MKIKDTSDNNYIDVDLLVQTYSMYKNLCLSLEETSTHMAYATLTVNICFLPPDCAAIDTNNHPEAIAFIEENELGTDTGRRIKSGFCEYPVYQFDMEKLCEMKTCIE